MTARESYRDYRHLPYYREKRVEEGEESVEQIMDDAVQGLGVPGRSGFLEVYSVEIDSTYAEVVIFDGNNTSEVIPLYSGGSIGYAYEDNVWMEWIKIKSVGGWVKYRVHVVPGLHPELEEGGDGE